MRLLFAFLGCATAAGAAVIPYEPTPGAVPSSTYRLEADGMVIPVEHFKDVNYARLAVDGTARMRLIVTGLGASFTLSPLRANVPVERHGDELSFPVHAGQKLILQSGGLEKLFLFADARERNAPRIGDPEVVNVLDYVSDHGGRALQRDRIQRALDEVARRPNGGTLYFPAGTYLTGTLVIHSHTTVYLASGALLQGTADPADYYVPGEQRHGHGTGALIYFQAAVGSRLIGRGTLAGRGTEIRKRVADHPRLCNLVRSRNCEIADLVLRDSGGFNIHALSCENLYLHGYKIINDLSLSNQDGTDPDSCHHIRVEQVFMYTSDDAIAVKADEGLCEDVLVKDCVFWTKKSALKVGSDPYFGARHIRFEHNDVIHSDRALALYARHGFIEDADYVDNAAEFVGGDSKRQNIVFLVSKLGPGGETARGRAPYTGYIAHVRVDGFSALTPGPEPSVIAGDGPRHSVSDVVIRGYTIAGRPVRSAADGNIRLGPNVTGLVFESP